MVIQITLGLMLVILANIGLGWGSIEILLGEYKTAAIILLLSIVLLFVGILSALGGILQLSQCL